MKIKNIKTAIEFAMHVNKNDKRPITKKTKDAIDLFVTILKGMK